jgi:hypothetical protein
VVWGELEGQSGPSVAGGHDNPVVALVGDRLPEQLGVESYQGGRVGAVEHNMVQSSEHAGSMTDAVPSPPSRSERHAEQPGSTSDRGVVEPRPNDRDALPGPASGRLTRAPNVPPDRATGCGAFCTPVSFNRVHRAPNPECACSGSCPQYALATRPRPPRLRRPSAHLRPRRQRLFRAECGSPRTVVSCAVFMEGSAITPGMVLYYASS